MTKVEEAKSTEIITKENICGEIQLKRRKENLTDNNDEEEFDEKLRLRKQMLKALHILRRGLRHRGNVDVFK